MGGYKEQLDRVRRYLVRIQQHDRPHADYDDDMWSFFQHCWHLKDWLKNDLAVAEPTRKAVETVVATSPDLLICADLANATKHLQLDRSRAGAKHSHKNYLIVVGHSSKVEYFIDTGSNTKIDGVLLAKSCVAEWERILTSFGLAI